MDAKSAKTFKSSYTSLATVEQNECKKIENEQPKDRFCLLRIMFFLSGVVSLMPVSFIVTANNYWMNKLKDDTLNITDLKHKNSWQTYFSSVAIICQATAIMTTGLFMLFVGHKIKVRTRLYSSLIALIVCLLSNIVLSKIHVAGWQAVYFTIAMILVFAINVNYSVFFISSMVMVSKFPKEYLRPYLYGEGYSGVIVSLMSLSTLIMENDPAQSVMIYFNVGIALLIITLILLFYSKYTKPYIYYVENNLEDTKRGVTSIKEIVTTGKNVWPSIVVFNIMVGTLVAVHPSLTALVVSENYGFGYLWNDKYFIPVVTFLLGDICGVIGRYFATGFIKKSNTFWTIVFMIFRLVLFIFLIIHCNIFPRKNLPVLFNHDWQYILIIGSLTLSNGFIHNSCIMSLEKLETENLEMAFTLFSSVTNMTVVFYTFLGPLIISFI